VVALLPTERDRLQILLLFSLLYSPRNFTGRLPGISLVRNSLAAAFARAVCVASSISYRLKRQPPPVGSPAESRLLQSPGSRARPTVFAWSSDVAE
jgi:hypothetical protein